MQLPTGQLDSLHTGAASLLDAFAGSAAATGENPDGTDPATLIQAFDQLFDVMKRAEVDRAAGTMDTVNITRLGEYALQLTGNLAAHGKFTDDCQRQTLACLTIGIALWIARQEGNIDTLEPVVDALALYANATSDTQLLAKLNAITGTIIRAVSPVISQDLEKTSQGRPWRVLLLNQGIVATRSHDTVLMEQAFSLLTEKLPEDAGSFFAEGMQQMEALDYPRHVREIMARYHRQWNTDHSLH